MFVNRSLRALVRSLLLLPGLMPALALGAPAVTGITGAISDGTSITISGSGFGTNSSSPEWLAPNIEAGTVGSNFAKTNWDMASYGWSPVLYGSSSPHSGAKDLQVAVTPSSNWNGEFAYHLPTPVGPGGRLYVSWWVRYSGGTNGQWKMLRLSGNDTIVDGSQEMVFFNWLTNGPQLVLDPGTGNDQTFWPSSIYYPKADNNWYRMEVYVEASSAGSSNGTARVTRYDGSSANTYSVGSLKTHTSSSNTYSNVIFQNYIGNGITGTVNIAFDDIYIQNSQARVELCDSSTWSGRKQCEIQIQSAWSDGSITAKLNLGKVLSSTARFLYVVDASGNVNANGYTLASSGIPPSPPNSLQVQ